MSPVILASQSPRRIDLLKQQGIPFEVFPADVEEAHDANLTPWDLTCSNARLKARAVSLQFPESLVIGADTLVYLDGVPIGKPIDLADAESILQRLQGRTHQVCTGVSLHRQSLPHDETFYEITNVTFKALSTEGIRAYLMKIDPLDKAGAYAAQDHGEDIIARIEGPHDNVVGLPLGPLIPRLRALLSVIGESS